MREKILGFLLATIFRVYSWTFRYEVSYEDPTDKDLIEKDLATYGTHSGNHIYALFHQQEILMIDYFRGSGMCGLVSNSKDGQILANIVHRFGYRTVRGSSHKGAIPGLKACMRKLKEGYKISIAVDGPKGPIYKVKSGAVFMSNKSETPIVPISAHPDRYFCSEKSWNKILIPKLFTKIKIKFGKVGYYTEKELEEKLNSLREYVHPDD